MDKCYRCLSDSNLYVKDQLCCELRRLAKLPNNRLFDFKKNLTVDEWVDLKPKLIEERKRLKAVVRPVRRDPVVAEKSIARLKELVGGKIPENS